MHKKIALPLLAGVLMPLSSFAGTIAEGAVVCISQKYLEHYEKYMSEAAESYTIDLLARAQCVVKKKESPALLVSEVGKHIRVQTPDGFKVWLNAESFDASQKPGLKATGDE